MKRIAIFASGDGSNAEAIARYFASSDKISVKSVLSNRQNARVHNRMSAIGISSITFPKETWQSATEIVEYLDQEQIDLIVLAGFMSKIETPIISAYSGRIINIHPSLLPRHGGPGMWGRHVHEAVISCGDSQSGITIHYVTEEIDGGEIIFQASCDVASDDTPETLAEKIHELEHRHFPKVIEQLLQ